MDKKIDSFLKKNLQQNSIDSDDYITYGVKKGLRNEDGTGVLVGLTKISDVVGYKRVDGVKQDDHGTLYYRGYNVKDIIHDTSRKKPTAYEEVCFLILFGYLPSEAELKEFRTYLAFQFQLPDSFLEMNILTKPSSNLLNKLQQLVLMLYDYDENADDNSVENTLIQGLNIVSKIPIMMCYAYQNKQSYVNKNSLFIHHIREDLSIAENILYLLRADGLYTENEATALDTMLVIHADHGGGNNSTFTNIVISSTGTDIYSTFVGSIGSMKGPKHGGANFSVLQMFKEVKKYIGITSDRTKIRDIVNKILDGKFYDNSGLIYGIGHAVYTLSDPRSLILQEKAKELAIEKGRLDEFKFLKKFEEEAVKAMYERKGINVSSNVDFYSGFVYDMLNIPEELYTLLFVAARSVGWVAHNIENKINCSRIVRPASKYVGSVSEYKTIKERGNHE